MMKKHIFVIGFLLIFCIISACSSSATPDISLATVPPNSFTSVYEPLSSQAVNHLSEVMLINSPSIGDRLLRIGYLAKENLVVGVYKRNGTAIGWAVDTGSMMFMHDFGVVTSKGLMFVASGKKLVGATENNFRLNSRNQNVEYINGLAIWDTISGELIQCISYPCQGNPNQRDGFLGNVVAVDGGLNATFTERVINILDLSSNTILLNHEINPIDASYQWQIGSVAFDSRSYRYAVVFQEGRIYVSKIERPLSYQIIAEGKMGNAAVISDTQIDPTGRWLVVAWEDKVSVLSLDNGKVLLEINVTNPVLTFDRTGELLFVGSEYKLTIYRLREALQISEYDTSGITSLVISDDNRLVIWGDIYGKIHIWGKSLLNH
jgi:hypothetical protein